MSFSSRVLFHPRSTVVSGGYPSRLRSRRQSLELTVAPRLEISGDDDDSAAGAGWNADDPGHEFLPRGQEPPVRLRIGDGRRELRARAPAPGRAGRIIWWST